MGHVTHFFENCYDKGGKLWYNKGRKELWVTMSAEHNRVEVGGTMTLPKELTKVKILVIDNKKADAHRLQGFLQSLLPKASCVVLNNCQQFMYVTRKEAVDIAFIASGRSGIRLAKKLQQFSPHCNIIFVEDNKDLAYDSLQMRPSGYLLKPVAEETVQIELAHLRYPITAHHAPLLRVKTFGNFVVYTEDGHPLHFSRAVSREILAYLIDQRGYPVTGRDIAAYVLEEEDYTESTSKKISQYVSDLIKDMRKEGYENVILKQNRQLSIDKEAVDCDLYHYLEGDPEAVNAYHGEYMIDYSWAEFSDVGD